MSHERPRIEALDSLRFLAALAVVLEHTASVVGYGVPRFFPLAGMANAYSAVALFFVLSGYVLQRSWKTPLTVQSYAAFQVRRIFRLYPLHVVGLGFAALLLFFVPLGNSDLLTQSDYARDPIKNHDHHDVRQWVN
jgi:peptidoglycan/LPS O-acetylase OafA/YrhL